MLIEGNKIARVAKSIEASGGATVIGAKGRMLTPDTALARWATRGAL